MKAQVHSRCLVLFWGMYPTNQLPRPDRFSLHVPPLSSLHIALSPVALCPTLVGSVPLCQINLKTLLSSVRTLYYYYEEPKAYGFQAVMKEFPVLANVNPHLQSVVLPRACPSYYILPCIQGILFCPDFWGKNKGVHYTWVKWLHIMRVIMGVTIPCIIHAKT